MWNAKTEQETFIRLSQGPVSLIFWRWSVFVGRDHETDPRDVIAWLVARRDALCSSPGSIHFTESCDKVLSMWPGDLGLVGLYSDISLCNITSLPNRPAILPWNLIITWLSKSALIGLHTSGSDGIGSLGYSRLVVLWSRILSEQWSTGEGCLIVGQTPTLTNEAWVSLPCDLSPDIDCYWCNRPFSQTTDHKLCY